MLPTTNFDLNNTTFMVMKVRGFKTNITIFLWFSSCAKLEVCFHIKQTRPIIFSFADYMDPIQNFVHEAGGSRSKHSVEAVAVVDLVEEDQHEDEEALLVLVGKVLGSRRYSTETMVKVMEKS